MAYEIVVSESVTDISTVDDVTTIAITENPVTISEQVTGLQGPQGIKGDTGATGPQGPSGVIDVDAGELTNTGSTTSAQLGLATVGTAGTYTKVTTDAFGRVSYGTTLGATDIPNLDAGKITTGTFTTSQIPNLDAGKITSGALDIARGGTGLIYGTDVVGQAIRTTAKTLTNTGNADTIFTDSSGNSIYLNVDANTLYQYEFFVEFNKKVSSAATQSFVYLYSIATGSTSAVTPQSCRISGSVWGLSTTAPTIGYFSETSANTIAYNSATATTTGQSQAIRVFGYILTNATTAGRIGFGIGQGPASTAPTINGGAWCVVRKVATGTNLSFGNWT